jgi:hypothetical protein
MLKIGSTAGGRDRFAKTLSARPSFDSASLLFAPIPVAVTGCVTG